MKLVTRCIIASIAHILLLSVKDVAPFENQSEALQLWLMQAAKSAKSSRLVELLDRIGPNMRASSDYHDFNDIKLPESVESWKLLHEAAQETAKTQVHFYGPKLSYLFSQANVSASCQDSVEFFLKSIENLNSWAVQMWSSSGSFPPVGLFNGHFTDLGSYRGCVDLELPPDIHLLGSGEKRPLNQLRSARASYCTVSFRPVVPSRSPASMVFHEHKELMGLFNESDVFRELAHRAQYFHYLYLRTGVCLPYTCSSEDLQQVSRVIAQRLALMAGPVKCFTRHPPGGSKLPVYNARIEDQPVQVDIEEPMNRTQLVALVVVCLIALLISGATLWHLTYLISLTIGNKNLNKRRKSCEPDVERQEVLRLNNQLNQKSFVRCELDTIPETESLDKLRVFCFNYLSVVTNAQEFFDTSVRATEIRCLHGIRVVTMIWIIVVHTFQYNEWSGFFRVFESVKTLQNPILHPIYNANYTVDNFFLMSGLLVAYTLSLSSKNSTYTLRNIVANMVSRYLRLTPQVLLLSCLYILLPLIGDGPFWYDASNHASCRCQNNWWINLLHLQSFYKDDQICNLVSWWISVDMFYYVISVFIMYLILNNSQTIALTGTVAFVGACMLQHIYRHYTNGLTPNNLGTVPQVNEIWSQYVVYFFWSPFTHAYPFFMGLWLGFLMANNKIQETVRNWSNLGWLVSVSSLVSVNLSSHIWMAGYADIGSQYVSTAYNFTCAIIWSSGVAWIIVACHYGTAKWLSDFLSTKPFILLSKASFIIYLSHMLILRTYFGLQLGLLELSVSSIVYALAGNIILSISFGVFLCIVFEGPCMKIQRFIVQNKLRQALK